MGEHAADRAEPTPTAESKAVASAATQPRGDVTRVDMTLADPRGSGPSAYALPCSPVNDRSAASPPSSTMTVSSAQMFSDLVSSGGVGATTGAQAIPLAIALRGARQRRGAAFPTAAALFHEPAWDMLLDLFIADGEGVPADLATLCDSAAVSTATGLRWITTLETLGLVQATLDPASGRPRLHLSDTGMQAMLTYLTGAPDE